MGRIVDLCGEIAAAVEEGADGFVLSPEAWAQLREDWPEEDIQDGINLVTDSFFQAELVEAADSLSARLVEILGAYGEEKAFSRAVGAYGEEKAFSRAASGQATLDIDVIRQLAHRLEQLEEILEAFRDDEPPDRQGFDALQRRLMEEATPRTEGTVQDTGRCEGDVSRSVPGAGFGARLVRADGAAAAAPGPRAGRRYPAHLAVLTESGPRSVVPWC